MKFRSCGIEEIKTKIMAAPEKHKETSVFIASKAQIERAKAREKELLNLRKQQTIEQAKADGILQGNQVKQLKAIIQKENKIKDPFRMKKAVTFRINLTNQSDNEDDDDEDGEDGESAMEESTSDQQKQQKDNSGNARQTTSQESNDTSSSAGKRRKKQKNSGNAGAEEKVMVVSVKDDVEDVSKANPKRTFLSKEQKNS